MERNEKKHTMAKNLWDEARAVLRGKIQQYRTMSRAKKPSKKQPKFTNKGGRKTTNKNLGETEIPDFRIHQAPRRCAG